MNAFNVIQIIYFIILNAFSKLIIVNNKCKISANNVKMVLIYHKINVLNHFVNILIIKETAYLVPKVILLL